jgi:hypothetical protein
MLNKSTIIVWGMVLMPFLLFAQVKEKNSLADYVRPFVGTQ